MACRNSSTQYGCVTKSLHWLVFILVTGLFTIGFLMGDAPNAIKGFIYNTHKLTGLTVLVLMVLFVLWSLINPKPRYPAEMPGWEKRLARIVHMLIYLLVIAMPLSGLIMSNAAGKNPHLFGIEFVLPGIPRSKPLAGFFADVHEIIAWSLVGILSLHILGALKHHFLDKNNILLRMMGKGKS